MARHYRAPAEGGFYHVTNRGNNKQPIFLDRGDGLFFLKYLAKGCLSANIRIHAYCLMTNHYHLLVETPEANLSYALSLIQAPYARHFNKKYNRTGHVFQGSFRSCIIEVDEYYLTVVRYIMQNPMRANITQDLGTYEFCSYRMSLGFAPTEKWFAHDYLMGKFTEQGAPHGLDGKAEFLRFVREQDYTNLWEKVVGDVYLGSPEFIEKFKPHQLKKNLIKAQARPRTKTLYELFEAVNHRSTFINDAYFNYGYYQVEIAKFLGVSNSTISRAVRNIEKSRSAVDDKVAPMTKSSTGSDLCRAGAAL